jgi:hypothetical protein
MLVIAFFSGTAAGANEECRLEAEVLVCDLQLGQTTQYLLEGSRAKSLKLVNSGGVPAQITRVWVEPKETGRWGEYCLSIGVWQMGQNRPGAGEVACTHKDDTEPEFNALQWDSNENAPSLAPGSALWVGGYVLASPGQDHRKTVYVTASKGVENILLFRQPQTDVPIRCDATNQVTADSPWQNTLGRDLTVSGALIYAVDPRKRNLVDHACISVLDAARNRTRWRYCTDVNMRGKVKFPPISVAPGEFIAAQATNNCAVPGTWDWAAYIYVR